MCVVGCWLLVVVCRVCFLVLAFMFRVSCLLFLVVGLFVIVVGPFLSVVVRWCLPLCGSCCWLLLDGCCVVFVIVSFGV